MPSVKTNEKPRVLLHFQQFEGGKSRINSPKSWEITEGMDPEKAFEFAVAKYREEMFPKKPERHKHE